MRSLFSILTEMVLVFSFAVMMTISSAQHNPILSGLCLVPLVLGCLLSLRSDPPWWHGASFCAAFVAGRLLANMWLLNHQPSSASLFDDIIWVALVIGLYSLIVNGLKARRNRSG